MTTPDLRTAAQRLIDDHERLGMWRFPDHFRDIKRALAAQPEPLNPIALDLAFIRVRDYDGELWVSLDDYNAKATARLQKEPR